MATSTEFAVQGARELADLLTAAPDRVANNVMRGAMRAGAVVIRDLARKMAPVGDAPLPKHGKPPTPEKPGDLRRGIQVSSRIERSTNEVTAKVGITRAAFYGRFVESGTLESGQTRRSRRSLARGRRRHHATTNYPFMRPAADEGAEGAAQAIVDYATNRIESEVAGAGIFLQGFDPAEKEF
jgi:HK97 gp10 family phage protein